MVNGRRMEVTRYRITVKGRLSDRFVSAFENVRLDPEAPGTVLIGEFSDQTQLFGVLDRLRDLGIEVVGFDSH